MTIRSLPLRAGKMTGKQNSKPVVSNKNIFNRYDVRNKRNHKRIVRFGLLFGNITLVLAVLALVLTSSDGNTANISAFSTAEESKISNPLDALSASDVAVNIALATRLPEAGMVINDTDSVTAEINSSSVNTYDTVIKPQILSADIKTKSDITEYVTVEGDTIENLATRFGVTSDSIKWSNNLGSTKLAAGKSLVIPPVNGIVYSVKAGDNAENLASKYNVSKEAITSFNDAEITGLVEGDRILIPGGVIKAAPAVSRSTPYYAGFAFGDSAIYGYNGYVPGYCTWYVANKRIAIGRPLPANLGNAGPWARSAPRAGFIVNNIPASGDAVVTDLSNPGHVGFVERVDPDGTVFMSEMNRRRRFEVTTRTLSPAEASRYTYIH
jgi:surface antigen